MACSNSCDQCSTPYEDFLLAYDLLQWAHDSNLTITLLIRVVIDYAKSHLLPETIYIQMDNTSHENKNKYVLSFCVRAPNLQKGILNSTKFSTVVHATCLPIQAQVNFLPIGHTHEDVDLK